MASRDLTSILDDWPHERGKVNARILAGDDGRRKLQVRLDLGILQMEVDGRPDGTRPSNHESLLAAQLARRDAYGVASGTPETFVLSADECRALREEAIQYYHRYVALFALAEFELVVRDTRRNLELFDLCQEHAAEAHDRAVLEQFRPSVVAMRARAEAEIAVARAAPRDAVAALDAGLEELRTIFAELGGPDAYETSGDVQLLQGMRDTLVPRLPGSQRVELEERLQAALDAENYELAAILRDELRML